MNNDIYRKQVSLLIRIVPSIYRVVDFAIHGGTAINLFHKDMPRYSVDIDLTYIPIQDRDESLANINRHLLALISKKQYQVLKLSISLKYVNCFVYLMVPL